MSADNGIYILPSPVLDKNGTEIRTEFRVAECSAIENIYYDEMYLYSYFKDSQIYKTRAKALEKAAEIFDMYGYTEYGIVILDKLQKPFPERK
jgi:hypothetical protein